ncbi:MAG: dihydropteroate synthase, partial [Polyangiaceae bacterium]|nr:dihydropteroate synthase [Polyangiaceae bacterium]
MQRGEPLRSTGTNDADEARGADGSPPCAIWGVLNVTPDSFSDGGLYASSSAALARGRALLAEGADVIDVGGESTRPAGGAYGVGFDVVPESEERDRVVPVIRALTEEHGATVSVDTTKPEVARAALEAGARIVNDVSGGRSNELLAAVAGAKAELVLMHNRGRGEVAPPNTTYEDVVEDVLRELFDSVGRAIAAGVAPERIWIDPGLGFAKTPEQSIALLAATARFAATGHRVLVGASRKGFIAYAAPRRDGTAPPPNERLGGTAATVIAAARLGAAAVRVHDVSAMRQALLVASAIDRAS